MEIILRQWHAGDPLDLDAFSFGVTGVIAGSVWLTLAIELLNHRLESVARIFPASHTVPTAATLTLALP
jgi:phosphotransferase system  glucose/maltose/N-acetylglucosamine-specific IIC component